jgi:hypothetical protein
MWSEVAAVGRRKVSRVQEWVSRTKQLLQSQSSFDHLTSPEVLIMVTDFKDVLWLHPSPDLVSTMVQAMTLLLQVTGNLAENTEDMVELLQLLLTLVTALVCESRATDTELVEMSEQVGKLVVQCGQTAGPHVLDGLAGHVLGLVANATVFPGVRVAWLRTLHLLLMEETETSLRDLLRKEYTGSVETLVDWLYTCGDFAVQTWLVEVLLR